jgi:hypothetical protein
VVCPIQEILEVDLKSPCVFTDNMNNSLTEEVTEVEVLSTLSSMQRGNIPEPNRLTVELYVGFYD